VAVTIVKEQTTSSVSGSDVAFSLRRLIETRPPNTQSPCELG